MKKKGYTYLAGCITLCFCIVLVLGVAGPVQAHDGTVGSDVNPIVFNDMTPYSTPHVDQAPWKGFFQLWTQNSTSNTWIGFNFTLSGTNVVFIDDALYGDCSWAYDGDCQPRSSKGISSYSISTDQKSMSVYFNNDWSPTDIGWIRVYTDNTADSSGTFTITSTPIVPEPVSSTLFLVGAATLVIRRFKKRTV